MCLVTRKPDVCISADQLCINCAADQRLCFRNIDGTIPLPSKSEISSLYPSSENVQPDFVSETGKTGFLVMPLI